MDLSVFSCTDTELFFDIQDMIAELGQIISQDLPQIVGVPDVCASLITLTLEFSDETLQDYLTLTNDHIELSTVEIVP